jgi:hypothetical protein
LLGDIYLPPQVAQSIREHVEEAVRQAESGYSSALEEEDTVTGELGGALRTLEPHLVEVPDGDFRGTWRWQIGYSKFGSKAKDSTESLVGADGVIELHVGAVESQRKAAIFQAKNSPRRELRLVEQCAKMSNWRESAFVIGYAPTGFYADHIDACLASRGLPPKAGHGTHLATWLVDVFIACQIGHRDLRYDKERRRLYWIPQSDGDGRRHDWVWVDFSPKHLIQIDVTRPDWQLEHAREIEPHQISKHRLNYTPESLFGISAPTTTKSLKKLRTKLRHAYHTDINPNLKASLRKLLDRRFSEFGEAFDALSSEALPKPDAPRPTDKPSKKTQSPAELQMPATDLGIFKQKRQQAANVKNRTGRK